MKRYSVLIAILLISVCFVSCKEKEKPPIDTESISSQSETEVSFDPLLFPVQYIKTGSYREGVKFPYAVGIGSEKELEEYIESNETEYYSLAKSSFAKATEKYGSDYFDENMLIFAVLQEGSGSIRHEYMGIDSSGVIEIRRITPEAGTCDMAEWHIIIEAPKAFASEKEFTAQYYGEDNRELAVFAHNFAYITARVPKGWGYDIKEYDESQKDVYQQFGLEFYPMENPDFKVSALYNTKFLGMCGTGLISESVSVNGRSATLHRYQNNNSDWALYYFGDLAGIYTVEINGNSKGKDYENEIAEILETLELSSSECIGAEKAKELAAAECTVEYDYSTAEFDFINGVWRVHFGKHNTAGGDQTVLLYVNGKYHSSQYGE